MKIVRLRDRRKTAYGHKRRWMYVMGVDPITVNGARGAALVMPEVDAQLLVEKITARSPGHEVEGIRVMAGEPPKR